MWQMFGGLLILCVLLLSTGRVFATGVSVNSTSPGESGTNDGPSLVETVDQADNTTICLNCEKQFSRQNVTLCVVNPEECGECLDGFHLPAGTPDPENETTFVCLEDAEVEPRATLPESHPATGDGNRASILPVVVPLGIIACMVGVGILGQRVLTRRRTARHAPLNPRRTSQQNIFGEAYLHHQHHPVPGTSGLGGGKDQLDGASTDDEEIFDVATYRSRPGSKQGVAFVEMDKGYGGTGPPKQSY